MPLKGLFDRLYIIPIRGEPKKGLIHTDQINPRHTQGIVKYKGPKVREVKIGDHVYFSGYDGSTIVVEGEGELLVMSEDYIQAIDKGNEKGDWLFTFKDVRRAFENAINMEATIADTDEEKERIKKLGERMIGILDGDLCERLFF